MRFFFLSLFSLLAFPINVAIHSTCLTRNRVVNYIQPVRPYAITNHDRYGIFSVCALLLGYLLLSFELLFLHFGILFYTLCGFVTSFSSLIRHSFNCISRKRYVPKLIRLHWATAKIHTRPHVFAIAVQNVCLWSERIAVNSSNDKKKIQRTHIARRRMKPHRAYAEFLKSERWRTKK